MIDKKIIHIILSLLSLEGFFLFSNTADIRLPPGFKIGIFAGNLSGVREMCISPSGTVFAGSFGGDVYAITENEKNHTAGKVRVIARNLKMPVGVAFYRGDLYVSAVSRILKYPDIESHLDSPPEPTVINDTFPQDEHHGWKFIRFGPDGRLYVPVGAPCNVCESKDKRYATIMRMNPDGTGLEIFAEGVRNTVGFDWDPETGLLWFTDNGRDYMGDDLPPDELDFAPVKGLHFGFPYIHGKNIIDPEFGKDRKASGYVGPVVELGPHVAALGMRFYTGNMFPAAYKNCIFIAEHGSWNRSVPTGYRITVVKFKDDIPSYEVFASGWLSGGSAWGRPADVEIMHDGSLLVSDDKADTIYRIRYNPDDGTTP